MLAIKTIFLLAIAFFNFLLALLIWFRGRTKATLHLGITALFSGIFALTCGGMYFFWGASHQILLFISRFSWVGVLMLPSFVTFVYHFVQKTKHLQIKSSLLYLVGIVITILSLTTLLFVKSADYYIEYSFLTGEKPGALDPLGRIYILVCLIIIIVNLLKYYLKTTGIKKLQAKYFITGTVIYAGGGVIAAALLPLFSGESFTYIEIPAFLSFFWVVLTAYAILKYRLMDIRIVLGEGVAYVFSLATVIGAGFLAAYLNSRLPTPLPLSVIASFIALLSILLFQLHKFYEKLAARYFYHTFYNTELAITELEERLTQVLELETLSSLLINTLINTLKLDKAVILTKETGEKEYIVQRAANFTEEELSCLIKESLLLSYIERARELLVREEVEQKIPEFQNKTKKLGLEVFLPLIFERKIIGIIILGNKLSGEAFSSQDLDLLTNLSRQASIALKNASLFAELGKRKEELERFYRLTVGRELKMVELKKKIKELEEKIKK